MKTITNTAIACQYDRNDPLPAIQKAITMFIGRFRCLPDFVSVPSFDDAIVQEIRVRHGLEIRKVESFKNGIITVGKDGEPNEW